MMNPPPTPSGPPLSAPSPTDVDRPSQSTSRVTWIAAVAILAVAAIALGVFAVVSSSAANDARAERNELRNEILDGDAALERTETELGDATTSLAETQEALTEAESMADTLQDERDDLQQDLAEAQDAAVENANPFATQEQLNEFRVLLSESRTLLTTATSLDELTPFFFTFDADFNELIELNVTTDLSDCKIVLANNGFATTILVASSIASLLEFEPESVEEAQAEIASADPIAESIFDQACGPLPES